MDLELLKKELNLFMKWIDRSSHEIPNEDWMNEQNVKSYMDSLEFKTRVWAMPSDENGGLHKHGVTKRYFWIDTEGKPSKSWDEKTHKTALTDEDIKYAKNMGWKLMEIEVTI